MALKIVSNLMQALGRLPGLEFLEDWRREMDTAQQKALQQYDDMLGTKDDFTHAGDVLKGKEGQSGAPPGSEAAQASSESTPDQKRTSSTSRESTPAKPSARRSQRPVRGTIKLDQFPADPTTASLTGPAYEGSRHDLFTQTESTAASAAPTPPTTSGHRGTVALDPVAAEMQHAGDDLRETTMLVSEEIFDDQPPQVAPNVARRQLKRLQYACYRLRRARHPYCPANGILTLLPLEVVQEERSAARELERAIHADLMTAYEELQVRCPVSALVTGMEEVHGFRELVRRVGKDRASAQRFGQRFDVRSLCSVEQMAAFTSHVIGVFEDWIYALFKEKGALARPGNLHLFGLLCQTRLNLKSRLAALLARGFGHDPEEDPDAIPVAFSGCYFAATGATEDKQAFVHGVFDKLSEEQDFVEWTHRAIASNRNVKRFAWLGFLLTLLLTASLLWMVFGPLL